jgi:hypothetical protein
MKAFQLKKNSAQNVLIEGTLKPKTSLSVACTYLKITPVKKTADCTGVY